MTLNRLAPEDAEAPPPYTPSDPLTPSSSNVSTTGESQQRTAAVEYVPLYSPSFAPANFISARGYFQERPPERQHQPDEEILEHALTIYTRSKAKDYHRFPRCWRSRLEEISKHDWKTFLNYLFPSRLGPASHRPDLPPKLRAELQRDQKDRAQESDEEGKSRIAAVVSEWNDFFFVPRGTAVIYCYGSEDGSASVSPLCPNCYPSSVRSMQPGQDATRSRATGTTSSQTLVDPSAPTPEAARNADTEPTTQPETQANSTNRDTSGGTPPLGLFAGAVNLVHNWAARKAQLAQMCGEQAGEWGMALGQHAHNRGLALGKHAELRGKVLGARAEALGKTLEQRADWVWQMALTDPWRFAGVHSCDDGTRERRYSTSSSSSSSESSDDDDDTISTLSTDSDWDQDDLAVLRSRIQSLRERHNEARNLVSQDSANVLRQKEELLAVRLAHHELRKCTRRRGRNRGPKISTAERKAVREELRGLKRDYRALRKQARSERIKVRKEERKRRKEERKVRKEARKAARKVNRRQMGRAQFGQWSRGGQCGRDPDPLREVETGIVNINIEDDQGVSSTPAPQAPPTPSAPPAMPEVPASPAPPTPPAIPGETAPPGVPGHHHHHHHHHQPAAHCPISHAIHTHAHNHPWGRVGWPFGAYHRHYNLPGHHRGHSWGAGRGGRFGHGHGHGPGSGSGWSGCGR